MSGSDEVDVRGALGGETARVLFEGCFQGQPVQFDLTLRALGPGRAGQFIDVGPLRGGVRRVEVGLQVRAIDMPTVRKSIIMLANYRRLREGRHTFSVPEPEAPA